ncbi:unnamed protein product, partial [Mesorhabditis belari]|uniref:LysM domain-containing protein n=1 Tax=Mesorhabditis belari TaxID=2138241 RepID=A0AAF3F2F0_9BILA
MDYTVSSTDTLERIAAAHDCTVGELMKLNRMASRMVFPGQKIVVPNPMSDDVFDSIQSGTHLPVGISGAQAAADGIRKGPGGAIPSTHRGNLLKTQSAPVKTNSLDEQVDSDCLQRFLKIKVKQLTESDGTVTGTLLVTPNCLMFDPDVSHPLVRENGPDLYGMVANMEDIMAVSVYKDVGALMGDKSDKRRDIFRPDLSKTSLENEQSLESDSQSCLEKSLEKSDSRQEDKETQPVTFSTSLEGSDIENGSYESASDEFAPRSPRISTEMQLPSITEERGGGGGKESPQISSPVIDDLPRKRSISDGDESKRSLEEGTKGKADLQASQSFGSRYSPQAARRSFGKLGRTLSAKAKSGVQTMAKGAESVAASAARGTKTVAHGVVSHTKSAADTLQTGIQTSAKVVGESAKAAADKVAQLPENIVSKGSELIADGVNGVSGFFNVEGQQEQRTPQQMKREQSLATLEGLKQKTAVAREQAVTKAKDQPTFLCAMEANERKDLFVTVDQLLNKNSRSESETDTSSQSTDLPTSPIMPFFMAVRLTRKRIKKGKSTRPSTNSSISSYDEDCAFGNRLKREFWFTIPRNKADSIYGFLLQWSPEKYGQDTTQQQASTQQEDQHINIVSNDPIRGFIVLDSESDDALSG